MTRVFPLAVACLELSACLIYLATGNVRMTILWGGYAVAAFALAGVE